MSESQLALSRDLHKGYLLKVTLKCKCIAQFTAMVNHSNIRNRRLYGKQTEDTNKRRNMFDFGNVIIYNAVITVIHSF